MTIKGKDLIERIKDKEYSEDLIKELEKYEVKKHKSVWELKDGDACWQLGFFDRKFGVYEFIWDRAIEDYVLPEMVHLTKERAELHARVLNTEMSVKKWKRENDNVKLDWSDIDEFEYILVYNCRCEEVTVYEWSTSKFPNTIYFSSESAALQCVNNIGKDRIIEWIKWEDNDQ